jgi:hypothetical protein
MLVMTAESALGGAVGAVAVGARRPPAVTAQTPEFGRDAYLAVSETEVALVRAKQGMIKLRLTNEVHARAPIVDVVSAEMGSGKLACALTIAFADGGRWEFDVPRAGRRSALEVTRVLEARAQLD